VSDAMLVCGLRLVCDDVSGVACVVSGVCVSQRTCGQCVACMRWMI